VVQTDLPVGSKITVGSVTYTIAQMEVPRFDTAEVYLLKFPSGNDFATGNSSESISVAGCYAPETYAYAFSYSRITSLNGFDTLVNEAFNYSQQLAVSDSGRTISNHFTQSLSTAVHLGPQTRIYLSLNIPSYTQSELKGSNPTRSADASGIISVYPPVLTSGQRDTERQNLLTLLSYVTIKKKT
jgi:hypothetical protein